MGTEVDEGSGDEIKVISEVDGMDNDEVGNDLEVIGLIRDESNGIEDNITMGDAKVIGKNKNKEETAGKGKQHSEEFEQTGPVELHDPEPANTAILPASSNLI